MTVHERFGERVRRRRMALGMIQKTLAEALDMPQGHLSRLEHGEFVSIRFDVLLRLAQQLQCSTDFLLGRTDDPDTGPAQTTQRPRRRPAAAVS